MIFFFFFTKHLYTYKLNSCKLITLTENQVQSKDITPKHYQQKKDVIDF